MTQITPGVYDFAGNAELSEDGSLEVLGVPSEADCWAEDEEGAAVFKITSDGRVTHLRGAQIVWDAENITGALYEAQNQWPDLKALVFE